MKTQLALALSLVLTTACGAASDELSDSQKQSAVSLPETAEGTPDLRGWQIYPGATDSCLQVGADKVLCKTEFQAGTKNCSTATFKFIAIKDGYEYVQTKENVFIRQGEFHSIEFDEKADIYKIQDTFAEKYYHVFRCYGADGEIIKY